MPEEKDIAKELDAATKSYYQTLETTKNTVKLTTEEIAKLRKELDDLTIIEDKVIIVTKAYSDKKKELEKAESASINAFKQYRTNYLALEKNRTEESIKIKQKNEEVEKKITEGKTERERMVYEYSTSSVLGILSESEIAKIKLNKEKRTEEIETLKKSGNERYKLLEVANKRAEYQLAKNEFKKQAIEAEHGGLVSRMMSIRYQQAALKTEEFFSKTFGIQSVGFLKAAGPIGILIGALELVGATAQQTFQSMRFLAMTGGITSGSFTDMAGRLLDIGGSAMLAGVSYDRFTKILDIAVEGHMAAMYGLGQSFYKTGGLESRLASQRFDHVREQAQSLTQIGRLMGIGGEKAVEMATKIGTSYGIPLDMTSNRFELLSNLAMNFGVNIKELADPILSVSEQLRYTRTGFEGITSGAIELLKAFSQMDEESTKASGGITKVGANLADMLRIAFESFAKVTPLEYVAYAGKTGEDLGKALREGIEADPFQKMIVTYQRFGKMFKEQSKEDWAAIMVSTMPFLQPHAAANMRILESIDKYGIGRFEALEKTKEHPEKQLEALKKMFPGQEGMVKVFAEQMGIMRSPLELIVEATQLTASVLGKVYAFFVSRREKERLTRITTTLEQGHALASGQSPISDRYFKVKTGY